MSNESVSSIEYIVYSKENIREKSRCLIYQPIKNPGRMNPSTTYKTIQYKNKF